MTDESFPKRRLHLAAPALILLVVLATYVSSYVMLVNLPSLDHVVREVDRHQVYSTEVVERYYSHGGRIAEAVFWPIEQIDRRVRRQAWGPQ